MPDNEVVNATVDKPNDKIDGLFKEDDIKKGTGTITYNDGTVLNFTKYAFDNNDEAVKKVLKDEKYKYVSPFRIAKVQGKTLDERCYVPGKLGGLMESEVQETAVAIKITYGPTTNIEYDDKKEAVEILVDNEGNIHGDSDEFNTLKGSGYYLLQRPEDVIAEHPEIIDEYNKTVTKLTKIQIKDIKVDNEGFFLLTYTDGATIKFDKVGKIIEDKRLDDPEKPYEDFDKTLTAKILEEINDPGKDGNKLNTNKNHIAIIESKDMGNGKFIIKFADASEIFILNNKIISDTRTIGRKYQSAYKEMIYKYTELLDVSTDYFHEDPDLTESEQRRMASLKIMNLPRVLLEKYTANRAMKQARVGHTMNSANSLGFRTSTSRLLEEFLSKQEYKKINK